MRIAFLGDIAFLGAYSSANKVQVKNKLSEIASYLGSFDYVVGNLETPFSEKRKPYGAKSAFICANPDDVNLLNVLHINAVNLANNHMFDYGKEGFELTKKILSETGIEYFGVDGKTYSIEMDGNKLRFMGFCCYSTNPQGLSMKQGGYGVNKYNVSDIHRQILEADHNGFFSIVASHVGLEHVNYPSIEHIRAARSFSDICPYFYYGHHPHVVQGVEEYKGSLIAHSLGNFCFDDIYTSASGKTPLVTLTDQNRTGMILELTIENNKIVSWTPQFIHIGADGNVTLLDSNPKFDEYCNTLITCENNLDAYNSHRKELISMRIACQKSKRNLMWYLKRLKPQYIKLFFDMKMNAKMYKQNVQDLISH